MVDGSNDERTAPPGARPEQRVSGSRPSDSAGTHKTEPVERRQQGVPRKAVARPSGASGAPPAVRPPARAAQGGPAGARPAKRPVRVRAARPAAIGRSVPRHRTSASGLCAALIAFGFLLVFGLGAGYAFFWRNVQVTVNGSNTSVRIGTPLDRFLEDNGYFGVAPGRLLSIGGNVITEDGGTRATVTFDGRSVAADAWTSEHLGDGSSIEVGPGADVEEGHAEETVEVAPQIEKRAGGAIQFVSQWGRAGKKTVWTGEVSGEQVDREVLEPAQNMVVSSLNVRPEGEGKYIALTFDDGPSGYTQRILDILAEKGAKATFFNLGSQVVGRPALAKAVLDGGNELASHTNQHKNLPDCDRDTLRSEISTSFDALEAAVGSRPQMIRAPYGAFTDVEWARAADLISCNVLWNIDTLDWKRPGAQAIVDGVLSGAYNGAIALMHDGGGNRDQDIEALPAIIDGLRAQGYELVTVSELMATDSRFPREVVEGAVKMPEGAVLPAA